MEQVIRAAIPIRIKNVDNPAGEGTIIFPDTTGSQPEEHTALDAVAPKVAPSAPASLPESALEPHLGPTAITIKDTVVVLSVHSNRKTISHGFFARIFGTLDKHGIVVDLISTSEVHVSMAIHGEIRKSVLDRVVRDLKVVGEVSRRNQIQCRPPALAPQLRKNCEGSAQRQNLQTDASRCLASQITLSRDMAILSLVGKHMKNMVGVAGKMFR